MLPAKWVSNESVSDTVLLAIKRKEIELQTQLLEARQSAEALVEASRQWAVALRSESEAEIEEAVRRLRESRLAEIEREAGEVGRVFDARAVSVSARLNLLASLACLVVWTVAPGAELSDDALLG